MPLTHLILWDGECGLCRRIAAWIARRDKKGQFTEMPNQECPSPPMTPELSRACENAVHVITDQGKVLRAGRAVLFILERIGFGPFAKLLTYPPFIWGIEIIYKIVARNRPFFSRFIFTREHGKP